MSRGIPYEHFHPDERPFVDRAAEWIEAAAVHKAVRRTDFLDPRQAFIVESLSAREGGTAVRAFGGYEEAERKRLVLVPDFLDPELEPHGVAMLAVTSEDARIKELEHGDYLGAMLGLGVKREKIGDIHVHDWGAHVFVAEEMAPFFASHLTGVGRTAVAADVIPLERFRKATRALAEMWCTVPSLRLDCVVGEAARLSRAKAAAPIRAGRCRVNWKVEEDPSAQVKEGDVISLQGFGRFTVVAVEGMSKSGRYRLRIGKFA